MHTQHILGMLDTFPKLCCQLWLYFLLLATYNDWKHSRAYHILCTNLIGVDRWVAWHPWRRVAWH